MAFSTPGLFRETLLIGYDLQNSKFIVERLIALWLRTV
jgi:hypothetical protein